MKQTHARAPLDVEQARAIALAATDWLVERGIAPDPMTLPVAYAIAGDTSAALRDALAAHAASGRAVDRVLLQDLKSRHLDDNALAPLQALGDSMQALLGDVAGTVDEAGREALRFGDDLAEQLQRIERGASADALRALAQTMVGAAHEARAHNAQMRRRLDAAMAEVGDLRMQLRQRHRESLLDPLTQLWNRRGLDACLAEIGSDDAALPLSVAMIDIDHFKRINDGHGHALGDTVIRTVAATLRGSLRASDHAVRFGGEEFLLLLPGTASRDAVHVSEALRLRVAALRLKRRSDGFVLDAFTVSIGVATRAAGEPFEHLLQRADAALYRAKDSGRNRTVAADAAA